MIRIPASELIEILQENHKLQFKAYISLITGVKERLDRSDGAIDVDEMMTFLEDNLSGYARSHADAERKINELIWKVSSL